MAEKDEKALKNITDVINSLPPFEQGRLYGYADRVVEESGDRKESA